MSRTPKYSAEAVTAQGRLSDIRIRIDGKTWHLWGRDGFERERTLAAQIGPDHLPVLLGTGLGECLHSLIKQERPVAVVDKERELLAVTGLREKYSHQAKVLWLDDDNPITVWEQLSQWQAENGDAPLAPVIFPLYPRLDRNHYGALAETIKADKQGDFWSQARYAKFRSASPRVLFVDSNYFLCGEILSALEQLGIEHRRLKLDRAPIGSQSFIEGLLKTVIDFKPDFLLTVNHFGLDREGKLAGLLMDLGLPLASWFVDNPHLILHDYAHPGRDNTVIFTYDAGNLDTMRNKGFANVHYLPLATDPNRFTPGLSRGAPQAWASDVSFVGNSMIHPVEKALAEANLPQAMGQEYQTVAAQFGASGELSVIGFLEKNRPDWFAFLQAEPSTEKRLAVESLLTWEATRQYRYACINSILEFTPLIVGDEGWKNLLKGNRWRHLSSIDYYADLPRFYPCSKINFNCTSRQMIGAVNQRVFDVPACGALVLTDYRQQMESLFDLDDEAVVYRNLNEIPGLVERYLNDEKACMAIAQRARKRVLAHHTYALRLERLVTVMRQTFV